MSTPFPALDDVVRCFAATPRPTKFVDASHCSECAEHNATLSAHTPGSITLEELGNPGWDPICFVQDINAFRYYLPAMARLACGQGEAYYLAQFLFHLNQARIDALLPGERSVLATFLTGLMEAFPADIDSAGDTDTLLCTIAALRDNQGSAT